ncbi:MAG: histidyl-tRNA synthetase [Verrucomicrobiales bacterium]|jgi:histidyl-tRNA synthetase
MTPDAERHRALVDVFAEQSRLAGYGHIMSPIFEDLGVFLRVGESTDVVTKEMYDFEDKDGKRIALRPELTASVVRAFVQHNPPSLPWKAWYEGPQFRHEKPQAGRYRQFSQVGVEVLGSDDPAVDVEVISLGWRFYEELGMTQVALLLNSLGDDTCRPQYFTALEEYLRDHANDLSDGSKETLEKNPLRVLDSKRREDEGIIANAPLMVDYLSADTAEHFAAVRSGLDALSIPYEISPRLVRGLDYYTRTTFEFASTALENAQNAVGGGGRYDGLAESLGGKPTPGIGFALGVDRILLACDAEGVFGAPNTAPDVFIVDLMGGAEATMLADQLRRAGIAADRGFDGRSMKAQMKVADRSTAPWAVIIGESELAEGNVTVRDMHGDSGQTLVGRDELVAALASRLAP